MRAFEFIAAAPLAGAVLGYILFVVVLAFVLTLHRRRERAFANTAMTSPSVYVPGKVRTVQSPYFDTYVVASGSTVNSGGVTKMFGNVQGVGGVGPNITNMQQAFQLSGGESFLLSSFRVVPVGCALADVDTFMINNTVRLIIGAG